MKRKESQERETYKRKYIKVLQSEYAMHSYGIRLCVIEIKISSKHKLEQMKSSIALIFDCQ